MTVLDDVTDIVRKDEGLNSIGRQFRVAYGNMVMSMGQQLAYYKALTQQMRAIQGVLFFWCKRCIYFYYLYGHYTITFSGPPERDSYRVDSQYIPRHIDLHESLTKWRGDLFYSHVTSTCLATKRRKIVQKWENGAVKAHQGVSWVGGG